MNGKKVANFIRIKRTELGFTLDQLSAESGIPRYLLEKWEDGVLPPTEYLIPLAKTLQTDVSLLLLGCEEVAEISEEISEEISKRATEEAEIAQENSLQEGNGGTLNSIEKNNETDSLKESHSSLKNGNISLEEEKGYYEKLNEQIAKTDYSNYEVEDSQKGSNGFFEGERRFGQILCGLFLAIILFLNGLTLYNWVFRPRELTKENYSQFLEVDVVETQTTNNREYEVKLTSKKGSYPIYNLSVQVEVEFDAVFPQYHPSQYPKEIVRTVEFREDELLAGETLIATVTLPYHMYRQTKKSVIFVEGEL